MSVGVGLEVRRVTVALLCLLMLVPAMVLTPEPEQAEAIDLCGMSVVEKACDAVESGKDLVAGGADVLTQGGKGVVGAIGKEVGEQVGRAIEAGTKSVFDQLTSWVGEAAGWFFLKVTALITKTTSPNLGQGAFVKKYSQTFALALVLAVLVAAVAVMEGARRGDVGGTIGTVLGRLPFSILLMVVALAFIQIALNAVDGLSAGVAKVAAVDVEKWFQAGADWMGQSVKDNATDTVAVNPAERVEATSKIAAPSFVMLISSLLGVIGALGLWLELLMRDAAIYICALFLPLSLAASIWPKWSGVMRKTAELLIVLVVSKFFMISVVALAASFLGKPENVETVMAGSMMLIAAVITPYFLYKLIPFMEGAAMSRGVVNVGNSGARGAVNSSQMLSMIRTNAGGRRSTRSGGSAGRAGEGSPNPVSSAAKGGSAGESASKGAGSATASTGAAGVTAGGAGAAVAAGKAAKSRLDTAAASTGGTQAGESSTQAAPVSETPRPAAPAPASGAERTPSSAPKSAARPEVPPAPNAGRSSSTTPVRNAEQPAASEVSRPSLTSGPSEKVKAPKSASTPTPRRLKDE